jgi:hypothetical protein
MTTLQKITSLGSGLLLACGAIPRILWSFGGPGWSYWLGNLAFSAFLIIPGITILFAPTFALSWIQSFGSITRSTKYTSWKQLGTIQKIVVFGFVFLELLVGSVILITNLYRVLNGCSPNGDCPRL